MPNDEIDPKRVAVNGLGWFDGPVVVLVAPVGNVDDLRKARGILDKLIAIEESQCASVSGT
jgi:ABC-type Fe3+-citrate transport system substrate-binding protein